MFRSLGKIKKKVQPTVPRMSQQIYCRYTHTLSVHVNVRACACQCDVFFTFGVGVAV